MKIDESVNDKSACNVIVENAGPEDNGTWILEGMYKEGYKFSWFRSEAKIIVDGKKLKYSNNSNILITKNIDTASLLSITF